MHLRWRKSAAAAFAFVLCVAAAAPATSAADRKAGPVEIAVDAVSFAPLLPGGDRFDGLEYRGGIEISSSDERFGGYSGLVLANDGRKLVAVSDRGWWFSADVSYDGDRLASVSAAHSAPLLDTGGGVIRHNNARDAEGLAFFNSAELGGWLLVALERRERILVYNFGRHGFRARPKTVHLPRAARQAKFNQELEAVGRFGAGTRLAGAIFALSERFLDGNGNIRGWLIGGPHPGAISVRRSADYDVTDLAIMPDGDVLILERRLNAVKLAGMRIRRIALADIAPGATVDATTLLEANQPFKSVDNMEGIAVHRSPGGELRITIISDDNFSPLQRTLMLQFAFPADGE